MNRNCSKSITSSVKVEMIVCRLYYSKSQYSNRNHIETTYARSECLQKRLTLWDQGNFDTWVKQELYSRSSSYFREIDVGWVFTLPWECLTKTQQRLFYDSRKTLQVMSQSHWVESSRLFIQSCHISFDWWSNNCKSNFAHKKSCWSFWPWNWWLGRIIVSKNLGRNKTELGYAR